MRGLDIGIRCDADVDRGRKGISDRLGDEAEAASSDERGGNVYDSGVDAGIMHEGGHQQ